MFVFLGVNPRQRNSCYVTGMPVCPFHPKGVDGWAKTKYQKTGQILKRQKLFLIPPHPPKGYVYKTFGPRHMSCNALACVRALVDPSLKSPTNVSTTKSVLNIVYKTR